MFWFIHKIDTKALHYRSFVRGIHRWPVQTLCGGNRPVTGGFPSQRVSKVESVSMPWSHHVTKVTKISSQWHYRLRACHQRPVDSPHKEQIKWKDFPCQWPKWPKFRQNAISVLYIYIYIYMYIYIYNLTWATSVLIKAELFTMAQVGGLHQAEKTIVILGVPGFKREILHLTWTCKSNYFLTRYHYNAVNHFENPHNRCPIARPWGRAMGSLL